MPDLSVNLGLELNNPLILGSGPLSAYEKSIIQYAKAGCGAIILKTVTSMPLPGNPKPHIKKMGNGIIFSSCGMPNPGIKKFIEVIRKTKEAIKKGPPLIASLAGTSIEEHAALAVSLEENGADAVEINFSCPNLPGKPLGAYWLNDTKTVSEIIREVKKSVTVPLWVKMFGMPEHLTHENLIHAMVATETSGADVIKFCAAIPRCLLVNSEAGTPLIGNVFGAINGRPMKALGLRLVAEASQTVRIPIVGSGGVWSGTDIIEYLMVGARATEALSVFIYEGTKAVKRILKELEDYMVKHGYTTLNEVLKASSKFLITKSK